MMVHVSRQSSSLAVVLSDFALFYKIVQFYSTYFSI